MQCTEVYRFLIEELDEHLDEPSRTMIREHLTGCRDCTRMLDSLKKTVLLYKSQPGLLVQQSLTAHVLEAIQRSKPQSPPTP